MNILVLCPMLREYEYFMNALQSRHVLNHHYKVVNCGVGKVNAGYNAALEIANSDYDLVTVIGYSAASQMYNQGDFIMPAYARYHDVDVPPTLVPELEEVYTLEGNDDCTILTGDSFIYKNNALSLIDKFGKFVLFDMESTAIAQVCSDFNVHLLVMKLISDIPTEDNNLQSFEEFVSTHTDFSRFLNALEVI